MAEPFQDLTLQKLSNEQGVMTLNNMLRTLYNEGASESFQYGMSTAMSADGYMNTTDGVAMSSSAGWRMHRNGSIIGHSCLVNLTTATSGDVTFEVRVNDVNQSAMELEFASALGTGVTSKSLTEDRHGVSFVAGDIVQVYANETGTMAWDEVIGYIEVQFDGQ